MNCVRMMMVLIYCTAVGTLNVILTGTLLISTNKKRFEKKNVRNRFFLNALMWFYPCLITAFENRFSCSKSTKKLIIRRQKTFFTIISLPGEKVFKTRCCQNICIANGQNNDKSITGTANQHKNWVLMSESLRW